MSRSRTPSSKVSPSTKSIIIERAAKEKVTKAVGLVSAHPANVAPSSGCSTVVSTSNSSVPATKCLPAAVTTPLVPPEKVPSAVSTHSVATTRVPPSAVSTPPVPPAKVPSAVSSHSVPAAKVHPLVSKPTTAILPAQSTDAASKSAALWDKTVITTGRDILPSSETVQPTPAKHVEKPAKERVDAPQINNQTGYQKPASLNTTKELDTAVPSLPTNSSNPANTIQNTIEPNPSKSKDRAAPNGSRPNKNDKETNRAAAVVATSVAGQFWLLFSSFSFNHDSVMRDSPDALHS